MYSVILTELGIAVFENQRCLKTFPFLEPVEDYIFVKKGESRLSDLAKFLSNIEKGIEVNDHALFAILKKKSINVQLMSEEDSAKIQSSKPKILQAAGFAEDEDNAMSSRLREWYGLHFPELDNIIDSINGYSQIVLAGRRDDLSKTIYEDAGFPESKVEMLTLVTDKSRGGDISDANLAIVQTLAKQILELFDLRKSIEEHVETEMKKIAPNLSVILGTAVGARILAHAGSLKNLAVMPASTIQVLGAEKALFRSIKTGAPPPKHGLLFQHALVHAAPRWQRGKIARAVAGKAAIASRVDFHGGGLNQMLLDKLNIRVVEIEKKYVDAPPPREIKPEPFRDRFRSKFNKPKGKKRKKFGRR